MMLFFSTPWTTSPAASRSRSGIWLDERTRGPRRYKAQLWPGAGNGHWEYAGGEDGDLEKVTRKNLGKEIVVEGIWVEGR